MIFENGHLHESLRTAKNKIVISQQQPLTILFSNQSSFCNYFCQTLIKYYKINVITKFVDANITMNYTLPFLCFQDYILEKENLVEFLCDIAFSKYDIV